jgi:cyclase
MLKAIGEAVKIPLVASGGAGNMQHFLEVFRAVPTVESGLAASIFHYREVSIPELRKYLEENNELFR